jgi:hypothetical protein
MRTVPQVFLSYAHHDDKFFSGAITKLGRRLAEAYQLMNGTPLHVFIDKDRIEWGKQWREQLDASISESWFLIPIVTPSYLESVECRREFEEFLWIEKRLKRTDLVLPLLMIDAWQLDDERRRAADPVAAELQKRQWRDWREHAGLDPLDHRLQQPLQALARELGKAVRNFSVLSVLTGDASPPSFEEVSRPSTALSLIAQDALRSIGIGRSDDVALRIIVEAAKLAPEAKYDQEISLSRLFCGVVVTGAELSGNTASTRKVYSLAEVLKTPKWLGAREENLTRFRYDSAGNAMSRLKRGFSESSRELLASSAHRNSSDVHLSGDSIVDSLLKPLPAYRKSLLYRWIPNIDILAEDLDRYIQRSSSGNALHEPDTLAQNKGLNRVAQPDPHTHNASSLTLLDNNDQHACLRLSRGGLEYILTNKDGDPGKYWSISQGEIERILRSRNFHVKHKWKRNLGLFSIGQYKDWIYSHNIFPKSKLLHKEIEMLLTRALENCH